MKTLGTRVLIYVGFEGSCREGGTERGPECSLGRDPHPVRDDGAPQPRRRSRERGRTLSRDARGACRDRLFFVVLHSFPTSGWKRV